MTDAFFNFKGSVITAIVIFCLILVPLLILIGCLIFRKYLKTQETEIESIRTPVRRIFDAINSEGDAENVESDSSPTDPSKFHPPPDYGTLEPLYYTDIGVSYDNDKQISEISIECLPSYSDVMKNTSTYLMSTIRGSGRHGRRAQPADLIKVFQGIIDKDGCNYDIKIGSSDQAARLIYHYKPSTSPHLCNITIETLDGYQTNGGYHHIAYTFLQTGVENNFKCSSFIYYDNGYSSDRYCGNNVYPEFTQITRDNKLLLTAAGDNETEFMFDMLFLSFHNGSCATFETRCGGLLGDSNAGSACIDYSLVCHQAYSFCEESSTRCSDITSPTGSNNTIIAVTVVTLVLVLLIGLICFLCYKKNFFGFLKRNEADEDVRTRAMNIFSLQLASRGVDDNDGNVNTAATDDEGNPIDFSKFDPPPEYGSLEHLDTVGVKETDGKTNENEVLPSYGDVMKNFDNYTVTTQI